MNLTVHPPHALMCSSAVTMASALQAAGGVMGSVTVAMVLTSCNVVSVLGELLFTCSYCRIPKVTVPPPEK